MTDGTANPFEIYTWTTNFSDLAEELARFQDSQPNGTVLIDADPFRRGHDRSTIDALFAMVALLPDIVFVLITDHPDRLHDYLTEPYMPGRVCDESVRRFSRYIHTTEAIRHSEGEYKKLIPVPWPLENLIIGIEAAATDANYCSSVPLLLRSPAWKRCVRLSCSSSVDLGMSIATCSCCPRWNSRWVEIRRAVRSDMPFAMSIKAIPGLYRASSNSHGALSIDVQGHRLGIAPTDFECLPGLDWVLIDGGDGGDSPMMMHALRGAIDQCRYANIPAYVSRLGPSPCSRSDESEWPDGWGNDVEVVLGKPAPALETYRMRDQYGAVPEEWPEWARVRQCP